MTRIVRLLASLLGLILGPAIRRVASAATVRRGEAVIDYMDRGQGPVILLIPSPGRGRADFDDLADRLVARGFGIVAAEPRGIGGSRGPKDGPMLHDMASDLAAVLEAAGARPVVAPGHAFGNTVARTWRSTGRTWCRI